MQGFGALVLAAAISAAGPASSVPVADAPGAAVAEAYVAELDRDWNVTREIRMPCPAEAGCAVDLALGDAGLAAVHVRFDPPRAGGVTVTSRLEDRSGRASAAQGEVLALDRTGFGAGHYEARMEGGGEGRIIMMAVRVPGWTAPGRAGAPAERT